ncbi:glycoside hydrolase family 9 protein [Dyadobacter sp. BHUBP1]|uniref:glycoside hydrolase family 9 protein n=1 Tax=Dyadobacter sp. BHUBP1 TaxID=3424178 RepID=UPI003D334199
MKRLCSVILWACCLPGWLTAQNKILWDGEVADPASCYKAYGSVVPGPDAYAGNYCFRAEPDNFHASRIGFNCSGMWRADISDFDELRFFIKSNQAGQTTAVRLTTYFAQSNWVDIDPFIVGGGPLSTSYQEVRIPLNLLKTPAYDLSSVEYLEFSKSPVPQLMFFIDNVSVADLTNPGILCQPLSDRVLMLKINEKIDTNGCRKPMYYTLASETDGAYQGGVNPARVGLHYYVSGLKPLSGSPLVSVTLFLLFDQPLAEGQSYSLHAEDIQDLSGNNTFLDTSFVFSDSEIYGNVKANQIGYLPDSPKLGKLGNFLGDLWAMPLDTIDPPTFQVVSTSGQVAWGQKGKFFKADTTFSGEWVVDLDFSAFTTPGEYYLYVPGYGRSETFQISDQVYENVCYDSGRALYYQRTGRLEQPYAGDWAREALPATTAEIHASHLTSPLYSSTDFPPGTQLPMTRGWFDAGDYGRYIPTAASALFILFTAYELYPQKFPDGHLQIPESGNNVPDVLDELKYETDWLKQMQAPDGGVYFRVTPATWSSGLPGDEKNTLFISEKTTQSTAMFAAAMAMAYRNFKDFYPAYADTCLGMAKKAWSFLKDHEDPSAPVNVPGISAGPYPDPDDRDNRAWAAAELYKTTGEMAYHQDFLNWYSKIPHEFSATMSWQQHTMKAIWAYSTTKYPVSQIHIDEFKNKLDTELLVEYQKRTMQIHAYHGAYHPFKEFIGYGTFGMAQSYAFDCIIFSHLLDKPELLDLAKIQLDIPLGNNPLSTTFITGSGKRSPKYPLHWSTVPGKFPKPVPGVPVFGPAASLVMNRPSSFAIQDPANRYPAGFKKADPYPVLRRYTDAREAVEMSEFTIQEMAVTMAAFAFFTSPATPAPPLQQNNPASARRKDVSLRVAHPARELYEITLFTGEKERGAPYHVGVFDLRGHMVRRFGIRPGIALQLNVSSFTKGVYILKIRNRLGEPVADRKILVY